MEMESCDGYADLFPEIIKLLNILLVLPVGTALVERSFSQVKLVKTRLRSRINDRNLARLMWIATEGPELHVDFNEILDIFKAQNHRIQLCLLFQAAVTCHTFFNTSGGGGGGRNPRASPPHPPLWNTAGTISLSHIASLASPDPLLICYANYKSQCSELVKYLAHETCSHFFVEELFVEGLVAELSC